MGFSLKHNSRKAKVIKGNNISEDWVIKLLGYLQQEKKFANMHF